MAFNMVKYPWQLAIANAPQYNDTMSKRIEAFNNLEVHAWLGRLHKRLTAVERIECKQFIMQNDHLPKGEFEYAINRMFLGRENKPKHWTMMAELLTCANSSVDTIV